MGDCGCVGYCACSSYSEVRESKTMREEVRYVVVSMNDNTNIFSASNFTCSRYSKAVQECAKTFANTGRHTVVIEFENYVDEHNVNRAVIDWCEVFSIGHK